MKNLGDLPVETGPRTREAVKAILVAMDNNPDIEWWSLEGLIEVAVMVPAIDPILPKSARQLVYRMRRLGFIRGRKFKGEKQRRYRRITE